MRQEQVHRLTKLMHDRDMGKHVDVVAHDSSGVQLNKEGKAQNLLDAAARNSTPAELAAAKRAWLSE